jgi:hypothetical protein
MLRTITLLAVLVLTVAAGMLQGRLTNRWGLTEDLQAVGRKLEQLPGEFGDWQLVESSELDETSQRMLEPYGYVGGVYRNETTGAQVTMFVIVGPVGPIAVHTPEVCFGTRTYEQIESRKSFALDSPSSPDEPHTFWAPLFQRKDVDRHLAPTYYSWTLGDRWSAAEDPRFAFAGNPYLYKVQVTTLVPAGPSRPETDPCQEFLADFVTAVEPYLVVRQ